MIRAETIASYRRAGRPETFVDLEQLRAALSHASSTSFIPLEQLGLFVMKATSTDAGEFYLRRLEFAIVITDAGRGRDFSAG
ncbi:MAG: hypothetical protein M3024_07180, partial [Candidatus Dormibacteraeota bacterium]|nr:hypothetical protein [Candidatus Dormibacteraeota bacterium]